MFLAFVWFSYLHSTAVTFHAWLPTSCSHVIALIVMYLLATTTSRWPLAPLTLNLHFKASFSLLVWTIHYTAWPEHLATVILLLSNDTLCLPFAMQAFSICLFILLLVDGGLMYCKLYIYYCSVCLLILSLNDMLCLSSTVHIFSIHPLVFLVLVPCRWLSHLW